MLRKVVPMALGVLLVTVAPGLAQDHIDVDVGWALPNGDIADAYDGGIGVNGRFLKEMTPFTGLGLGLGFQNFGLGADIEDSFEALDSTVDGGGLNVLTAEVLLEAKSGAVDLTRFSGWIGAGLYYASAGDLAVTDSGGTTTTFEGESKARFGFSVGGAVHIPMGGFRLGATAQFRAFTVEAATADSENLVEDTLNYFTFALSASKDL